jgi:hypothetical protein
VLLIYAGQFWFVLRRIAWGMVAKGVVGNCVAAEYALRLANFDMSSCSLLVRHLDVLAWSTPVNAESHISVDRHLGARTLGPPFRT